MIQRSVNRIVLFFGCTATTCLAVGLIAQEHRDGYKDTPILPGQKWHVHDSDRPYPTEVIPGATPGAPPSDAVVLFDGKDMSHWMQVKSGKPTDPKWPMVGDHFDVGPGTGNLVSREKFGDCQLHLEWRERADVDGTGQGRGNSGIYMMSRYEVQILDSYKAHTYADGQAGAIYGQWPPLVNPQRKPGEWQTYDIIFEAPRFNGDKLVSPAYETVIFNGVLVHNHQKLNGMSGHREVPPYEKHGLEEPLLLQDHGPKQPLSFRNIWVRKLKGYDTP